MSQKKKKAHYTSSAVQLKNKRAIQFFKTLTNLGDHLNQTDGSLSDRLWNEVIITYIDINIF